MAYTVGCDPELFVKKDGKVIGSEKVVPATKSIVVRDGVQVEFNPPGSMTTSILGGWISQCFRNLVQMTQAQPGVEISFDQVVEVERAELDSLDPAARVLGCSPSFNVYGSKPIGLSDEERAAYLTRSAGGHLHFGLKGDLFDERVRLVNWLDVFVGNTCVLIDREPKAALRRKHYGRAGEYRIPNYGLEYRTLSNFWLRNYALLDLVERLAAIAVKVVDDALDGGTWETQLIDVVDPAKIVEAIDTNNLDLAWANFKAVSSVGLFQSFGLVSLMKFFERVEKNGLAKEFPEDPIEHWCRGKQKTFNTHLILGASVKRVGPSTFRIGG